jgi:hypothetical protein
MSAGRMGFKDAGKPHYLCIASVPQAQSRQLLPMGFLLQRG